MHLRGMGSGQQQFDDSRYDAEGNYIYFKGDLAHTRDLPCDFQVFGKVQGQISDQPLINSEQFSAGGIGTVRGYLESTALADNSLCGTLELRTPSLSGWFGGWVGAHMNEWRFYAFTDAAILQLRHALPSQTARFDLASYGIGSHIRFHDHFGGSFDLGVPLIGQGTVNPHDLLFIFRLWADF